MFHFVFDCTILSQPYTFHEKRSKNTGITHTLHIQYANITIKLQICICDVAASLCNITFWLYNALFVPLHQIPKNNTMLTDYRQYPCFMVSFLNDFEGSHREM